MSCSRIEQLSTYEYNKNHIEYKIPNSKKKKSFKRHWFKKGGCYQPNLS